ncbi:MAG: hypothetical protein EON98_00480 [Chitinophagaceae bacterium]|nr:MAG: hypothetical protein EON98_00480 [Chitinophagaceae bacterium]
MFFKAESYKKGTFYSVGFNVANKGIQLASILLISYLFGVNSNTDLYYYLFNLLTVIVAGFVSGMDISVLIPEFIRIREQVGINEGMAFINKYLIIYLVGGSVFFGLVLISPIGLYDLLSRFDTATLTKNITSLYIASLTLVFIIVTNLLSSVLASYRYFIVPNFIAFINNLLSIVFLLIFYRRFGLTGAFIGMAIGYIFNLILLIFLFVRKLQWNFFIMSFAGDKRIVKLIASNQLIGLVISLRGYVVQFLLSGLSAGTLTAINWGTQIASLSETFINSQVYSIAGLKFSEHYAKRNFESIAVLFYEIGNILATFSFAVLAVFCVFSNQIALLFDFKKHFPPATIIIIADTLKFIGAVTVINILTFLTTRLFAATQMIHKTLILSIFGQLVLLLCVWQGLLHFSYLGYLTGYALGFLIISLCNLWLLSRTIKSVSIKRIFRIFNTNFLFFLGCVAFGYGLKYLFETENIGLVWMVAIAAGLIGCLSLIKILIEQPSLKNALVKKFLPRIIKN